MRRTVISLVLSLTLCWTPLGSYAHAQKGRARSNPSSLRGRFTAAARGSSSLKARVSKTARSNAEVRRGNRGWTASATRREKSRPGLTTPRKYFGSRTKRQAEISLKKKYGAPRSHRKDARTYYNPKTLRSFNVHQAQSHNGGKPHVDVRRRGKRYRDRKYNLESY
jgi:hypothetical protein